MFVSHKHLSNLDFFLQSCLNMFEIWSNQECMPKIRVLRACEHVQMNIENSIINSTKITQNMNFIFTFCKNWECPQVLRTLIFGMHSWFGHIWNIFKYKDWIKNPGWKIVCEIQTVSVNLTKNQNIAKNEELPLNTDFF